MRAKPDTLLCSLLDDPERKNFECEPIFVEGDKQRFRYILDWYRSLVAQVKADVKDVEFLYVPLLATAFLLPILSSPNFHPSHINLHGSCFAQALLYNLAILASTRFPSLACI